MATFEVNLWGCRPGTEDMCWTGADYATLEEARAVYEDPFDCGAFPARYGESSDALWVELKGESEGVYETRCIQRGRPEDAERAELVDRTEWDREIATQAGMEFGVDGYNDAMGY